MKILVFDDSPTNLAAAEAQLKGHELTLVGSYDEARDLLTPHVDGDRAKQIFTEKYGDDDPYKRDGIPSEVFNERYNFYWWDQARKQASIYHDFDVVLSDLLVPASQKAQGDKEKYAEEMPVGIFIGLLAAKNGAKYVAVFTDSNHHDHPASACFDAFNGRTPTPFTVNGCKVVLCNTSAWVNYFDPNDLAKEKEIDHSSGLSIQTLIWAGEIVCAKNWAKLLDYLISQ